VHLYRPNAVYPLLWCQQHVVLHLETTTQTRAFAVTGPRAGNSLHQFVTTSQVQEISQDLFIQLILLEHESDY